MRRFVGWTRASVLGRAAGLSLLLLLTGCRFLAAESDWEPFDDARDLTARKQITWDINAVLLTDGQIIDFVRGPCRHPRFTEQGIAYRVKEGESPEIKVERGLIKGIMIGHYRSDLPPIPVLPGASLPGFK